MLRKVTRDYIINNIGKPVVALETDTLGNVKTYYYLINAYRIASDDESVRLVDSDGDMDEVYIEEVLNDFYMVV